MKKKNLRTRIIAISMAAISMLSAGSMFSVSAAETTPQSSTAVVAETNTSNTANTSTTSKTRLSLRKYLYNEIDHSKVNLTKRFENKQNIRLYNHDNGTLIVAQPKEKTLE